MTNWSTLATGVLGGGGIAGMVSFFKFLRDERRHRVAEHEAEENKPLENQLSQLGFIERATVIQQRAIESLEAQVEDQKMRYSLYKTETDTRIGGLEEKIRQLEADLRHKDGYIIELQGVISKMELELRKKRGASAGTAD